VLRSGQRTQEKEGPCDPRIGHVPGGRRQEVRSQLYFNSVADFQKAMGAHGKEIMGDVLNYTDIRPQVQISEIVG